jgi:predicted nucleic-acid-binding protein
MATKVLIDTNILVYVLIQKSQFYLKSRQFLERLIQGKKVEICIAKKSIFEMVVV